MVIPDYYSILELHRNSTTEEIKKHYRKLVFKYHPDVSKAPDSHEKFIEVNEAYQILINAESRSQYNRVYDATHNSNADLEDEEIKNMGFDVVNKMRSKAKEDSVRYSNMTFDAFKNELLKTLKEVSIITFQSIFRTLIMTIISIAFIWAVIGIFQSSGSSDKQKRPEFHYNYSVLGFTDFTKKDVETIHFPYSGTFNFGKDSITLVIKKPNGELRTEAYKIKSVSWNSDSTILNYRTYNGKLNVFYRGDSIVCVKTDSPGQVGIFSNKRSSQ